MKTRPIIFSSLMINALREGRKTQTRRIIKPQPSRFENAWWFKGSTWNDNMELIGAGGHSPVDFCQYQISDLLWVREAVDGTFDCDAFYCADENRLVDVHSRGWNLWHIDNRTLPCKKISPIFMPRWASRLTLEITGAGVERLQGISEEDAIKEGVEYWLSSLPRDFKKVRGILSDRYNSIQYRYLWESINGKGSWEANPWVWVLDFIVHNKNIDEIK